MIEMSYCISLFRSFSLSRAIYTLS